MKHVHRNKKIVIGIDLSLNNTGMSCAKLLCKNIQPSKKKYALLSAGSKIIKTLRKIHKKHGIDLIVMEDYGFAFHPGSISKVAEITGVVKYYLARKRIPLLTVAPTQLKKFITGSGRGKKEEVLKVAYKKWGIDAETSHETEATVLSIIGYNLLRFNKKIKKEFTNYEWVVLQKLNDKMKGR